MRWALMAIMSGTMLFSCKKEDDNNSGCSRSVTGITGSYKLTALQYKASGDANPVDYMEFYDDCQKDDIIVLKSDGSYDYNDEGITCDPDPDRVDHGSWKVDGNTLIIDGYATGTITSYDCKALVFYAVDFIGKGDKLTFTMERQ